MRKIVKLGLCGLAATFMLAGCSTKTPVTEESEVKKLGTYKGVEIASVSTAVRDEEVMQQVESILAANPEYIEVTDRAAQNGDILNIDYVGMKDGVAFDGGTAEGYPLELGSNSFIDGFEEGLVGSRVGDELSLNLTFPENYQSEELAGQPVVFDVTVNKIEEKKDAQLDDNFVQRMSDFTTVEEFTEDVRADMVAEREQQAAIQLENEAFQAVVDASEIEPKAEEVEEEYTRQIDYYNNMLQAYGMALSDYAQMYQMTEDEFKNEVRTAAEDNVKRNLVVEAIAAAEKMVVTDADLQAIADEYGMELSELQQQYGEEEVEVAALQYKVVRFVRDNAVVKEQ